MSARHTDSIQARRPSQQLDPEKIESYPLTYFMQQFHVLNQPTKKQLGKRLNFKKHVGPFALPLVVWIFCSTAFAQAAIQPGPKVDCGSSYRISTWNNPAFSERTVDVWLPKGYPDSAPYPVVYMHDGQMLFDSEQTWNKQSWNIDSILCAAQALGKFPIPIVVGIWNNPQSRHADYLPEKPFYSLSGPEQQLIADELKQHGRTTGMFRPNSDAYLAFLMNQIRPEIESKFQVSPEAKHTILAGSSMGGLISWYGMCEYPNHWGGIGSISTHWPGIFSVEHNPLPGAFERYLRKQLPQVLNKKWYLDSGTETLDSMYSELNIRFIELLQNQIPEKLMHWKVTEGADHSENSWSQRVPEFFQFLFWN